MIVSSCFYTQNVFIATKKLWVPTKRENKSRKNIKQIRLIYRLQRDPLQLLLVCWKYWQKYLNTKKYNCNSEVLSLSLVLKNLNVMKSNIQAIWGELLWFLPVISGLLYSLFPFAPFPFVLFPNLLFLSFILQQMELNFTESCFTFSFLHDRLTKLCGKGLPLSVCLCLWLFLFSTEISDRVSSMSAAPNELRRAA